MSEKDLISIHQLNPGMWVRHKGTGEAYVITANYSDYAIGVQTMQISHCNEWVIVSEPKEKEKCWMCKDGQYVPSNFVFGQYFDRRPEYCPNCGHKL